MTPLIADSLRHMSLSSASINYTIGETILSIDVLKGYSLGILPVFLDLPAKLV